MGFLPNQDIGSVMVRFRLTSIGSTPGIDARVPRGVTLMDHRCNQTHRQSPQR